MNRAHYHILSGIHMYLFIFNLSIMLKLYFITFISLAFIKSPIGQDFPNPSVMSATVSEMETKTSIHEIEYQFPYMLGYSYFHNFNNKFVPGIGAKFGFGTFFTTGGAGFDIFSFDIKMRNLFARNNKVGKTSYDLGFNYAFFSIEDSGRFYGLKASVLFTVFKPLRIGLSMRSGLTKWGKGGGRNSLTDYGILYFYPNLSFSF
jgi:hypothetical protein